MEDWNVGKMEQRRIYENSALQITHPIAIFPIFHFSSIPLA
jgi:hypothetical protein